MKKVLVILACFFMWCTLHAQDSGALLPTGIMTYNDWSGKISIGGETIPRDLENRYLSGEDYKNFLTGRTMTRAGFIPAVIGGSIFGYGLAYTIGFEGFDEYSACYLLGGGAVAAIGCVIAWLGDKKIRQSVANYNSTFVFKPEIRFGGTDNGVGLAIVF